MIFITYIYDWVKNIIFMVFIITVMELFLPSGRFKKYLKILLGFFIIIMIINPLTQIMDSDNIEINQIISLEQILNNYNTDNWNEKINQLANNYENYDKNYLDNYYNREIEEKVTKELNKVYPNYQKRVNVKLNKKLNLKKIEIILYRKEVNDEISISPVNIQINNTQKKNDDINLNSKKAEKIKDVVASLLSIDKNIIEVIYLEEGNR